MKWLALAWIIGLLLFLRWGYLRALTKARLAGREDMRKLFAEDAAHGEDVRALRVVRDADPTRTVDDALHAAMQRGRRRVVDDKPDDPEAA